MIEFRPLTEEDLPLLSEWLNRPHVAQWWNGASSPAEVREKYLGFVQSYRAMECGGGWWANECDPGVIGIDQFLAEAADLGRGLGPEMARRFVEHLAQDPGVTRIQADPSARNSRAIRCYEKAGFRPIGVIETPDGPALLMVIETERRHAATASEL